ncbi:peptidase inhibitor family I36 protein [Streptosporangium amethystogenes]|uniref:peptidase inhibitor family I36 protein n=1 Tax=Streptosporangium amethystogenes TaxID=2002 RepID=UPI0037A60A1B
MKLDKRVARIGRSAGIALAVASVVAFTAPATAATAASAAPSPAPVATSSASTSSTGMPSLLNRQARSDAELREQIALQMKIAPGGKQASPNEVSYDNGKFVVTYALPGQRALGVADCPSGWFCFYENINFGYPRGRLSDCGGQDLGQYGWNDRISSADNSTTNPIDYYDGPLFLFTNYNPGAISYVGSAYNDRADVVFRDC